MKNRKNIRIARNAVLAVVAACALFLTMPAWTQEAGNAADASGVSALLRLKPDAAQISVGLPSGNALLAKVLAFLPRVMPPEVNIQEEYDMLVTDWAFEAGVQNAKTLEDIAQAKGLTLDRPAAMFVDLTPTAASAKAAMEKAAAATAEATAAPDAPKPAALPAIDFDDLDIPALAFALGVSDQAKAQATLDDLAKQLGAEKSEATVGGITIAKYGDLGYFFADGNVFIGAAPLLEGIAARKAAPLPIRYGAEACPIEVADEIVLLAYGNSLVPLMRDLLTAIPAPDAAKAVLLTQISTLDALTTGTPEDDPMVMTLALTNEAISFSSRVDTATHPQLLALAGTPGPLRAAQYLPNDTQFSLALNLTKEYKESIKKTYIQGMPAGMKADMGAQLAMAQGIFDLLGQEITLGVTSMQDDFPAILLAIELEQPEMLQSMLMMFLPVNPNEAETYKEVTFSPIALPIEIFTPYIAFFDKTMLVSSDLDKAKQFVDAAKSGQPTAYFASLKPPIDPAVPRYKLFSLQVSLIKDAVLPLTAFATEVPPAAMDVLSSLDKIFTELRASGALAGTWVDSRVNLFLVQP